MKRHLLLASLLATFGCSLYACGSDDTNNQFPDDDSGTGADGGKHDGSSGDAAQGDASQGDATGSDAGDTGAADASQDTSAADSATDARSDAADGGDAATTDASDAGDGGVRDAASDADAGTTDAASDGGDGGDGGNVVGPTVFVVRVGDGTASLSNASTAVFLEEHKVSDGSVVRTISLPVAASGAQAAFTMAGSSTSEGGLTRSVDGHSVALAGFAIAPGTASIASSATATTNRVVARVTSSTVDTSTLLNAGFNAGDVRGAATVDGTAFWVTGTSSGTSGGVHYIAQGTTGGTQIVLLPNNSRHVDIFGGQLYGSSGSSGFTDVFSIGTGEPTTVGQIATPLTGFPTTGASPYAFIAFDLDSNVAGIDRIYVADDSAGIQKWTSNGTTWSVTATFNTGISGVRGVAGYVVGTNVQLLATTSAALFSLVDDGTASPTITSIATAGTNTAYRGVALSPTP